MHARTSFIFTGIAVLSAAFGLVACSPKHGSLVKARIRTNQNIAKAPGTTASAQVPADDPTQAATAASAPTCANPIKFDWEGHAPVKDDGQVPRGKWATTGLRFYQLSEKDQSSFLVSGDKSNQFDPRLECNGLTTVRAGEFEKAGEFRSDFSFAEWTNTQDARFSPNKRKIEISFAKGVMAHAATSTEPFGEDKAEAVRSDVDRLEVKPDTFFTARRYLMDSDHLVTRVKFEFPADQNGKRVIMWGEINQQLEK